MEKISRDNRYMVVYALLGIIYGILFAKQSSLLYLVFVALSATIMLSRIEVSITIFLAIAPLDRLLVLPNGIFMVAYLMPVLMMKMLYELIIIRDQIYKKSMNIIIVFFVFIVYELSHFMFYPISSISRNILYYSCMAVVVLFTVIRPKINYPKLVRLMSLSILVGSVISLQTTTLLTLLASEGSQARFSMLGEDINTFGVYLMIIIGANFALFINRKDGKIIHLVSILLLTFFGLLGLSRGFIFNLAMVIFVSLVIIFELSIKQFFRVLVLLLLGSIAWGRISQMTFVQDLFENYSKRFMISDLSNGRVDIYMMYLRYMQEHVSAFMYGLGINNYKEITQIKHAVHNTPLEILLSEGIIGIILLLTLVVMIFNRTRLNTPKNTKLFLLPLLSLFIGSLTLSLFAITSVYYYVLFILVTLEYNHQNEENRLQQIQA
jgi:O-antigen ligase